MRNLVTSELFHQVSDTSCKLKGEQSYIRSYAIKKKDEIERVAKANR